MSTHVPSPRYAERSGPAGADVLGDGALGADGVDDGPEGVVEWRLGCGPGEAIVDGPTVATAEGSLSMVGTGRLGLGAVVVTPAEAVVGTATRGCVRAYGPQAEADTTSTSASILRSTEAIVRTDLSRLDDNLH